jgi:hypothetical protein
VREKEALPAGWVTVADPASGRTYYYESASGSSQWHVPSATNGAPALKKRAVLSESTGSAVVPHEAADDSDVSAGPPGVDDAEEVPGAPTEELRRKLPSKSNEPEN